MRLRQAKAWLFRLVVLSMAVAGGARAAGTPDIRAVTGVPAGTKVWLQENHDLPLIAMHAVLPAGSARDPAAKAGLAAMAAQMLQNGVVLPPAVQAKLLSAQAVQVTTTVSRDRLEIALKVTPQDAATIFRLLGDALHHPRFTDSAVEDARFAMEQDLAQRRETPGNVARDSLYSLYYGPHPYGHPVGGSTDGLKAIRSADLAAFTAGYWVRGRIFVAFAGDLDSKTAKNLTTLAFGDLPQKPVPNIPPPVFSGAPGLHVMAVPANQPAAVFALPGLRRRAPDMLTAKLTSYILGGHETSRLMKSLRDAHNLTYQVTTQLEARDAAGLSTGMLQASPRDMREALSLVRRNLREFALEGPDSQEFADAKTYLRDSFVLHFASNAGSAAEMAELMADGWQIGDIASYTRRVDQISSRDVRAMAKRLYSSENLTIVVAGPLAKPRHSSNPYRK